MLGGGAFSDCNSVLLEGELSGEWFDGLDLYELESILLGYDALAFSGNTSTELTVYCWGCVS